MSQSDLKKRSTQQRQGGPMGGMNTGTGEKAKDFKGTARRLARYLATFRWQLLIVLIFAIGSTIFAIVSPKILGEATNIIAEDFVKMRMSPEMFTGFNFAAIGQIILWLIALYLLSALFRYLQTWIMTTVTQRVTYRLRRDISRKINTLPLKYFDKQTYGEVLSRVTNDVDTISQTLNQSLSQVVSAVVMIVGILAMMLSISWLMTVVALLVLPLSTVFIVMVTKRSQAQFIRQQTQLGELNGHIEEMYAGHQVMRVFNGQATSIKKFRRINDKIFDSALKSQFLSGLLYPIMNVIGNLGYVGVAVLGGWLAIEGRIKIGDIQAFIQYMQQFNQPIAQTANIASVLQSTAAAAERVFEFLDEVDEPSDVKNPTKISHVKGQVEFKNVVFGYDKNKPIIKGLSAKIKPGQRVAIVGPTGAGKTTLVNLLMRFYDIDKGQILVDGVDISQMKRAQVRQLFGMVLQDTWLFKGTIRDNLLYGNPDAGEEQMITTAKEAHVDHFVCSLPSGYDMELDEEATNISQGEKQLLTIARAMLAGNPMLILDEATSSVDTRTEVLIQQAMDRLMQGKTSFVIAHRLSTIRDADLILVVKDGNIIEQGRHTELLAQDGFYAELYNSQFAE